MAIEIYNKAKIVKKDDVYYFFLKHHSKNDCICGGQVIVDDDFNYKYIRRNSRAGNWSIKTSATQAEMEADKIADTEWNAPTSGVYGQIRFGDKKNIALYWAKQYHNGNVIDYGTLSDEQKKNVDGLINYFYSLNYIQWFYNLGTIPLNRQVKNIHDYCDKEYTMADNNTVEYRNRTYWSLDNL